MIWGKFEVKGKSCVMCLEVGRISTFIVVCLACLFSFLCKMCVYWRKQDSLEDEKWKIKEFIRERPR